MTVTHKITVHLDQRRLIPTVEAVQGDASTRVLELTLMSGGAAWTVPGGTEVSVAYDKSDGTRGWYDTLPDGVAACAVAGNMITAILAPQVLTAAGKVRVMVVVRDTLGQRQLAAFPVTVMVAANPAAVEQISNDYYKYTSLAQINQAVENAAALVCTITADEEGVYRSDTTYDQIKEAIDAKRTVYAVMGGRVLYLSIRQVVYFRFVCVEDMSGTVQVYRATVHRSPTMAVTVESYDMGDGALPVPSADDAGKVPVVKADGSGYTLATVTGEGEVVVSGVDGGYYVPYVDGDGDLSWSASQEGMPSVPTANIRGPQGEDGPAMSEILQAVYPVGAIYLSTAVTSPATLFGGTWERLKDRFLLGAGDIYTAGYTGGAATHTLAESEMPKHFHGIIKYQESGSTIDTSKFPSWAMQVKIDSINNVSTPTTGTTGGTGYVGGSQAHNNMPPYLTVYMWKRTA